MHVQGNVERFSGFADRYDAYRPQPPAVLVDILTLFAGTDRPRLVADIGSGTGLSTRIWAGHAEEVVGIEPNEDMRMQAEARQAREPGNGTIRYVARTAADTGLPDGSADIVTVSQALHWLEPVSTFAEAARVLRPGGIVAAYDCEWPPAVGWEAEAAYEACMARAGTLERDLGIDKEITRWRKSEHLARIQASGRFRYAREIAVHHIETGNAERLVGVALSQGDVAALLKRGLTEEQIGITALRAEAERTLGSEPRPWYWTYRVRLAVN